MRIDPQVKTVDNTVHRQCDQKVPQPHPTGCGHDRTRRVDAGEPGHGGGDAVTQPRPQPAALTGSPPRLGSPPRIGGRPVGCVVARAEPRQPGRRRQVGLHAQKTFRTCVRGRRGRTRERRGQRSRRPGGVEDKVRGTPAGQPARPRTLLRCEYGRPFGDPLPLADHRRRQLAIITTSRGHHGSELSAGGRRADRTGPSCTCSPIYPALKRRMRRWTRSRTET